VKHLEVKKFLLDQAPSHKLDKLLAVGYCGTMKNRKDKMTAKETIEQINNLSDADWQRMKEHMDKKFPNMAMPNMDTFKEMVKLFGMSMEHDEKKLN
tara:strand:- start:303 stop:593 length:291 start_codon:yes stop_codon:yes gene_type:complete